MAAKKHEVVYNNCYGGFSLSYVAVEELGKLGVVFDDDIPRHDKRLIKVVKKLGAAANGRFTELKIAKITGKKYRIEEYDGAESVIEPNDLEWTTIK